ncbi:hypothetical protein Ddc_24904 [Ditylenchus destructor]|nr:hypothetical protein Ddc_24904 [Ditylenchus destructor]
MRALDGLLGRDTALAAGESAAIGIVGAAGEGAEGEHDAAQTSDDDQLPAGSTPAALMSMLMPTLLPTAMPPAPVAMRDGSSPSGAATAQARPRAGRELGRRLVDRRRPQNPRPWPPATTGLGRAAALERRPDGRDGSGLVDADPWNEHRNGRAIRLDAEPAGLARRLAAAADASPGRPPASPDRAAQRQRAPAPGAAAAGPYRDRHPSARRRAASAVTASNDEVRQQLRQIAEPLRHELVQRHAGEGSVQVATGAQAAGDGRRRDGASASPTPADSRARGNATPGPGPGG